MWQPHGWSAYDAVLRAAVAARLTTRGLPTARTVLLSSFSKVMAPGLRLGWLRGPAELRRACVIAKQAADLHTSTIDQAAAARYLADRDLDAHLATVRHAYRERRDALLAGLADALPSGSIWNRPDGGMFLWALSAGPSQARFPSVVGRQQRTAQPWSRPTGGRSQLPDLPQKAITVVALPASFNGLHHADHRGISHSSSEPDCRAS